MTTPTIDNLADREHAAWKVYKDKQDEAAHLLKAWQQANREWREAQRKEVEEQREEQTK